MGPKCQEYIDAKIPANLKEPFLLQCLKFYVKGANKMQQRLRIGKGIFQEFRFLNPKVALYENERDDSLRILKELCTSFQNLVNVTLVLYEWQMLPATFTEVEKNNLMNMIVEQFWEEVSKTKI